MGKGLLLSVFVSGVFAGILADRVLFQPPTKTSEKTLASVSQCNPETVSQNKTTTELHPSDLPVARREPTPSNREAFDKGEKIANERSIPTMNPTIEASVAEIADDSEVEPFLAKVRQDNFFDSVTRSDFLRELDENSEPINGQFTGEVKFNEDREKRWEMTVEAALRVEDKKLQGNTQILLSENGKVFSHLSGRGDIKSYLKSDGSVALIIKASGDHYFQLYYARKLDAFIGNFYLQTRPGSIIPKGTVRLERG